MCLYRKKFDRFGSRNREQTDLACLHFTLDGQKKEKERKKEEIIKLRKEVKKFENEKLDRVFI